MSCFNYALLISSGAFPSRSSPKYYITPSSYRQIFFQKKKVISIFDLFLLNRFISEHKKAPENIWGPINESLNRKVQSVVHYRGCMKNLNLPEEFFSKVKSSVFSIIFKDIVVFFLENGGIKF